MPSRRSRTPTARLPLAAKEDDALVLPSSEPAALRDLARRSIAVARAQVDATLGETVRPLRLCGAVSPIGSSAHACALLDRESWPDVFIVLAASDEDERSSILALDIETPLGRIPCDRAVARRLEVLARPRLAVSSASLLAEREWQGDLLLLQVLAEELGRSLRVVAVTAGSMTVLHARKLGRTLAEVLFEQRKRGCVMVETALSQVPRTVFDAIAARRHDDAAVLGVAPHVSTVMELAPDAGFVLGHGALVTGERTSTATIAFTLGRPGTRGCPALRACDRILWLAGRGNAETRLVHLCDHGVHALGRGAADVVLELACGAASIADLARRLSGRWGQRISEEAIGEVVGVLADAGLLHDREAPSPLPSAFLRARAHAVLAKARRHVPHYRALPSAELERAPFLFADDVRAQWLELFRDDVRWRGAGRVARRNYYLRSSSSSSGAPGLRTVVEAEVMAQRRLDRLLVSDRPEEPVVAINRPDNLGFREAARRWPQIRRSEAILRIAPGPNPTAIAEVVWDRALELIVRAQPARITGDPAYLAPLARRAIRHGIHFPRLEIVEMSHSYAWDIYRDVVRRAFGVPISVDYNASEIGSIAMSCAQGNLHLIEAHVLYELFDRGEPVREGALGGIAATTLDTALRPMIRYVLGDVVRLIAKECTCGRPFRVIEYEGCIRNLLLARGRPVTFRSIDRAIGAPAGVDFFRVTAGRARHATLEIVPSGARELVERDRLTSALEECLARSVRLVWRDRLAVPARGKLQSVRTEDDSEAWHRRLFFPVARRRLNARDRRA